MFNAQPELELDLCQFQLSDADEFNGGDLLMSLERIRERVHIRVARRRASELPHEKGTEELSV